MPRNEMSTHLHLVAEGIVGYVSPLSLHLFARASYDEVNTLRTLVTQDTYRTLIAVSNGFDAGHRYVRCNMIGLLKGTSASVCLGV